MPTISEVRQQFPQYSDMSDAALADALHQKFYPDMPKPEFDQKIGLQPEPDKYQSAARKEIDDLNAKGIDTGASVARQFLQGASFNSADEILAGLSTPLEMIRQSTFNPAEAYRFAKAREDTILEDARKKNGGLGTVAELGGGFATGSGLARAGLSAGAGLTAQSGLGARTAASAIDGLGFGAVAGGLEGNSLEERGKNALMGGALGGALGGVAPGALSLFGTVASPVFSNISARVNPERFARNQVARALSESGMTPGQVSQQIADAAAAGQPFTVADALGNPGQRMLSTVARSPGQGRTDVVNFLEGRQAGQGARITQAVDEALGASGTARQTADELTKTAREKAAPFYEAALNKKPVWNDRLQQFFDDPVTRSGLKDGVAVQRLEALAEGKPFNPHDYAITGFNEAGDPIISGVPNMRTINLIKKGWDNQLEAYRDGTTGRLMLDEYGRALDNVRRSFLKEVDAVNPSYAKARELYAGPAQARDAVRMGADAASRGRAADNLRMFDVMNDSSQQGYRTGYADKLAAKAERGVVGVNKARPLTSDKATQELERLSLHQGPVQPGSMDPLQQRIARENTMFETRNQALGGSRTADNLADSAAMGIDPSLIGNVLAGNWGGALRSVLASGSNALSGNTAQVRQQVADILLSRGQNVNPASIQRLLDEAVNRIETLRQIASQLGRGGSGAVAVAPAALGQR